MKNIYLSVQMISIELNCNWKDVLGLIRASKETFQPTVRNMFSAVERALAREQKDIFK